jgi:hypothetical protein
VLDNLRRCSYLHSHIMFRLYLQVFIQSNDFSLMIHHVVQHVDRLFLLMLYFQPNNAHMLPHLIRDHLARPPVSRAAVFPKPLHHLQVPALSGGCATVHHLEPEAFIPQAPMRPHPLQRLQLPTPCARPLVLLVVVLPRPPQHI